MERRPGRSPPAHPPHTPADSQGASVPRETLLRELEIEVARLIRAQEEAELERGGDEEAEAADAKLGDGEGNEEEWDDEEERLGWIDDQLNKLRPLREREYTAPEHAATRNQDRERFQAVETALARIRAARKAPRDARRAARVAQVAQGQGAAAPHPPAVRRRQTRN